ncbi:MAG TPA: c-type cytochrome domain-containing protein, partial [Pricia sp.]|nr:c-type cytochrome domain-containing protein [Pricia sp.]
MKYKIAIIAVLALLIGLLFTYKKGVLDFKDDGYAKLKLPETVNYNFHIKPILSDNCYTCHGPDANKRKAGLRLDLETTAFEELPESPGKFPIVPKNLRESSIYQHIISEDGDELMPPPDSKLALNPYEKKLIKKWIEQGAQFEKHWAFLTPKKAETPKFKTSDPIYTEWGENEVDGFILSKLEENELHPSEKASDETLIRRISLDLTGLPPTP